MRISFVALIISLGFSAHCQPDMYVLKLKTGHRTKEINCSADNYLGIAVPVYSDTTLSAFRYYTGDIINITHDSIMFYPTAEIYNQENNDCPSLQIRKMYFERTFPVAIGKNQIDVLQYHSKRSQNWNAIGISSMILGGLTSLIVAPLISINYSSGKINSTRYITCASIGLTFISVGIPLTFVNKERKFYLSSRNKPNKYPIWEFN